MYDSLQQGNNKSTEAYLHRHKTYLSAYIIPMMSSITTIGLNHAKILTGIKASRLHNN